MGRLRREGICFFLAALFLPTLLTTFADAQATDENSCFSLRSALGDVEAANRATYLSSSRHRPSAEIDALPIVGETGKSSRYQMIQPTEAMSRAGPLLAEAARDGYSVSGKCGLYHEYYDRTPPHAPASSFFTCTAERGIGGGTTDRPENSDILFQPSLAPEGPLDSPIMIASASRNWISGLRLGERVTPPPRPPVDGQRPVISDKPIRFTYANLDKEAPLDKGDALSGSSRVKGVNPGDAWTMFRHFVPGHEKSDGKEAFIVDTTSDDGPPRERYHWRGLLAQSLFFNVIENTVRVASDDQIRRLLANKPFWHDYFASMEHFNMRRWNDGDDFLVNYVGHPMQGAVSGYIEIQNDPKGRDLEISASHAYWISRFKAFLWATAYSTHSEISPIGEAGIGNEGGWTYPIHCPGHCTEPGSYKKYTNNTGWVDFIITPTVGTLWLIAEDTLDRFVSDRIEGDGPPRLLPNIIRGALNPSRTMANAVRFKLPWYRDSDESAARARSYGVHFLPSDEEIAEASQFRRFSVSPYFRSMPFGSPSHSCILCMENPGLGVGLDYAFTRWMSASFVVEKQMIPFEKDVIANGSGVSVGLGMRFTYQKPNNSLSLSVRPGFITGQANVPENSNLDASQMHNAAYGALTVALSNDVKLTRLLSMRFSIGDTIIRYPTFEENRVGSGSPPYLSWLSKQEFTNRSTWSSAVGPVLRF